MEQSEQIAVGVIGTGGMHADSAYSRVGGTRLAAVAGTCNAPLRLGFRHQVAKLDTQLLYASAGSEVIR